jgi:hypothetical protein
MKNLKGLTLNHAGRTATITKGFARAMNDFNSGEYKKIQHWRSEGYEVQAKSIKEPTSKLKHAGLTVDNMERFVKSYGIDASVLRNFYVAKLTHKGNRNYYSQMKAWFFRQFPELKALAKRAKYLILTMDFMDGYIANHDNATTLSAEYNKTKQRYSGHTDYYAMI